MSDEQKRYFSEKKVLLRQRQSLPLEAKVRMTQLRIRAWYEYFAGDVYVAFSGGKDSTDLLHIARGMYPKIPAVFFNTGLEYPEIVDFVKQQENITWMRPALSYLQVIEKYGYPIISKEQAHYINKYRRTNSEHFKKTLLSDTPFSLSMKWRFMLDAPFKISPICCDVMKKRPAHRYEKETGRKAILGNMAEESRGRERQ